MLFYIHPTLLHIITSTTPSTLYPSPSPHPVFPRHIPTRRAGAPSNTPTPTRPPTNKTNPLSYSFFVTTIIQYNTSTVHLCASTLRNAIVSRDGDLSFPQPQPYLHQQHSLFTSHPLYLDSSTPPTPHTSPRQPLHPTPTPSILTLFPVLCSVFDGIVRMVHGRVRHNVQHNVTCIHHRDHPNHILCPVPEYVMDAV